MKVSTSRPEPEHGEPQVPGGKPLPQPGELPVEPDLGPVLPMAHPEDPGPAQPVI